MEASALHQNAVLISNYAQKEETNVDNLAENLMGSNDTEMEQLQDKDFDKNTQSTCKQLLRYQATEEQRCQQMNALYIESRRRARMVSKQTDQRFQEIRRKRKLIEENIKKDFSKMYKDLIAVALSKRIQMVRHQRARQISRLMLKQSKECRKRDEKCKQEIREIYNKKIQNIRNHFRQIIQQIHEMKPSEIALRYLDQQSKDDLQSNYANQIYSLNRNCTLKFRKVNNTYVKQIEKNYETCGQKIIKLYHKCKQLQSEEIAQTHTNQRIQDVYEKCGQRLRNICEENQQSFQNEVLRRSEIVGIKNILLHNREMRKVYEKRNFDISVVHHVCSAEINKILEESQWAEKMEIDVIDKTPTN